jgi:hypothetical protein
MRMIWTVVYKPEGQSKSSKTSLNDLASPHRPIMGITTGRLENMTLMVKVL